MAYSALLLSMVPRKQIADLKRGTNRINDKNQENRGSRHAKGSC